MEEGVKSEGVFRVPGNHSSVQKLADAFDNGENPDFKKFLVDDISGLLKKYLRELPEPLITDLTPEDRLQKEFHTALSIEDTEECVERLSQLVVQIPKYRRAVLCHLIRLLYKIKQHEEKTLMNSESLATIFGGMGDTIASHMTPFERTRLTRIFIDHYKEIFDDVDTLQPHKDEVAPGGQSKPEGVKVFLIDGTFRSFFCTTTEKVKDFEKKVGTKINQQLNIDTSKYKLFEILDGHYRLLGPEERVLPIVKTGSVLLFTDKLNKKKEKKEKKQHRIRKGKTKKEGPRSIQGETLPPLNLAAQTSKEDENPGETVSPPHKASHATKPSDHSSSAANAGERRPSNSPRTDVHKVWIFTEIPIGSMRATDWDMTKAVPGELVVTFEEGVCKVKAKTADMSKVFLGIHVKQVYDSTRYYVLCQNEGDEDIGPGSLGLGFETREGSNKFKEALISTLSLEQTAMFAKLEQQQRQQQQQQQPSASASSVPLPDVVTAAQKYYLGPLSSLDKIENGFYDPGHQKENEFLPSLESLTASPVNLEAREVLVINETADSRLAQIVSTARHLIESCPTLEEKLKTLALFVSNVMGGADFTHVIDTTQSQSSQSSQSTQSSQSADFSLEQLSKAELQELKKKNNNNIVLLGQVRHGLSRHRALLFKYLCDRQYPPIPVTLHRSDTKVSAQEIVWNFVPSLKSDSLVYIDLLNEPGRIYHSTSDKVKYLKTIVHESKLHSLIASDDRTEARKRMRTTNYDIFKKLQIVDKHTRFPEIGREKFTIVLHEMVASSIYSRIYRASLGPYVIAVKDVDNDLTDKNIKFLKDDTKFVKSILGRCNIRHMNIATCFGFEFTDQGFRILLEYVAKGSLHDVIRKRAVWQTKFLEEEVWYYLHQVAEGLAALHAADLYHGALRSSNVLLDGENGAEPYPAVKLTDFNVYHERKTPYNESYLPWFAPEVVAILSSETEATEPYDPVKADVWSLGMLLLEMVNLDVPYSGKSTEEKIRMIKEGTLPELKDSSPKFKELFVTCCQKNSANRPNVVDIIKKIEEFFPPFLVQQIQPLLAHK